MWQTVSVRTTHGERGVSHTYQQHRCLKYNRTVEVMEGHDLNTIKVNKKLNKAAKNKNTGAQCVLFLQSCKCSLTWRSN